ncbi:MAG: YifB family Mg chelatase-like AAA ATPase [Thermomicrobiales bacterium]|nr:YifB family Mg chelatase-like AAA ATPase [Thermomicrobiales bacterium]MCO5225727.1 YifB family Mg chelatase-like AAA ATPase [Thermomicrobiales bacterium]MCO5228036.1 YifB family Mg chelatase-like AAA ATPase [Thermomicrobiales bacterium]
MLTKVNSCAVVGLDGVLIEVEVDRGEGQPGVVIVGLPDTAVQESRERVRSAIRNSGGKVPHGRITINLAPADIRKAGPTYDLPIAIGVLIASGQVLADLHDALVVGELSLDGDVRHTPGIISMMSMAAEQGLRRAFVPAEDVREAALIHGVDVYPVSSLAAFVDHLRGDMSISPVDGDFAAYAMPEDTALTDFADIKGQEHVKRGLEVAAAGGHNLLMSGPPGSGKTLLARSMPGILPPMSLEESLEVTRIYSVRGMLPPETPLVRQRPFRAPHHTTSHAGLVGGGTHPRPGEISLAHRGVLFLDELPEFNLQTLEVLRQPLEDHKVTIARASGSIQFPANLSLIAAMNPCPCGFYCDPVRECRCSPLQIARYQKRISGPLLDRIDIHLEVPRIEYEQLADRRPGEKSAEVRSRVEAARAIQEKRYHGTGRYTNADMGPREVQRYVQLDTQGEQLIRMAVRQLNLSARAYHRVLKLSRTIADLAASEAVLPGHVAEALQYRPKQTET